MFPQMSDELLHLLAAETLRGVEAVGSEHLGAAEAAAVAPPVVTGDPREGCFGVWLGGDDVRDGTVGESFIVSAEYFCCNLWGGGNDGGD